MKLSGEIAAVCIGLGLLYGAKHEIGDAMGNAAKAGYAAACIQSIQRAQYIRACDDLSSSPQAGESHDIHTADIDLGLGITGLIMGSVITASFAAQLTERLPARRRGQPDQLADEPCR